MPIQVNHPAIARAKTLVAQGKVQHGKWDESKVARNSGNIRSFAAVDSDEKPDTMAHYKFPFIADGKVNATAVGNGITRAEGSGYGEVAKALREISDAIKKKEGALTKKPAPGVGGGGKRLACLRGPISYSDKSVQVDDEAGVIKNVSLMSVGPALGHGFDIDETTLSQLVALAGAQVDGVKSRFRHPAITEKKDPITGEIRQTVADDTGSMVGRIRNIRLDGAQVRGDVHLGSYAEVMPGLGDVRGYLLRHAKDDPTGIGMSAMFEFDIEPVLDEFGNVTSNRARLFSLEAVDFVGQPAANPNGLLSAGPHTSGWQDGDPQDPERGKPPVSTPEFPRDIRGDYLAALVRHGPMTLGGIAARFNGRLEAMHAGLEWLANNGYAEKLSGGASPAYKATAKGTTQAALCWK